jgi:hypothetical protein
MDANAAAPEKRTKPWALVLMGGGARGLTHVGVFPPDEILKAIPLEGFSCGAARNGRGQKRRSEYQRGGKIHFSRRPSSHAAEFSKTAFGF